MSQDSDGTSPSPEDENLDEVIQGFSNVELAGALLSEPIELIIQVPRDEHRIEQGPIRDLESDALSISETPSDEQVSREAADDKDVVNELPIPPTTVAPPPTPFHGRRRNLETHHIVLLDTRKPEVETDKISALSKEKAEFELAGQNVAVKVKDLTRGIWIDKGAFGFVTKLVVSERPDILIAVKHVEIGKKENRWKLCQELRALEKIAKNRSCPYTIDFYGALRNPYFAELCFLMELMQTNLKKAYTKLHEMKSFKMEHIDLLVRRVAYNIVSALKFMQDEGLSHNDVKPANILFDRQGHVKLADFGESGELDNGTEPRTHSNSRPGTPYYWPVEYTEINVICSSERCNLWALAVTLLETITNGHPYPDGLSELSLYNHIKALPNKIPEEKLTKKSVEFIHHLFKKQPPAEISIYDDILHLPYLAGVTTDPSVEETSLFESIAC